MLPEIAVEEYGGVLDAVAADVLVEAGVAGPPVDAFQVAATLGIVVAWDDRQLGRARCVRIKGHRGRAARPAILLRHDPRPEREQWAAAHEIGEHRACRVFAALGVDPREGPPDLRERVADQLAGRILLPAAWFAADGAATGWDLFALKGRYLTASHESIARRMLEMAAPAIVSIFDQGRLSFRRTNAPGRVPPLSATEVACWRAVHRDQRPHVVRDELIRVQAWPIHEDGWKREILRTEVAEEG